MINDDRERIFAGSAAIVAAVGAFFTTPILPFTNAGSLSVYGFGLGVGAGGAWMALRFGWSKWWQRGYLAIGLIGFLGVVWQVISAQVAYDVNLKRCAAIQADMLSAVPRRADAAEMFTALGCRPQGFAPVQFRAISDPKAQSALRPSAGSDV